MVSIPVTNSRDRVINNENDAESLAPMIDEVKETTSKT